MPRSAHLPPLRHRTAWLCALGLLAVALHVLAGTGLMPAKSHAGNGDSFAAEVCTNHGIVQAASSQTPRDDSRPASGTHDCCELCAAGGPLLTVGIAPGMAPAPIFGAAHDSHSSVRPTLAVRTAHPARGPPARA